MNRAIVAAGLAVVAAIGWTSGGVEAGERRVYRYSDGAIFTEHPKSGYYRKGRRVRGYFVRRGGYSYSYADSVNTWGNLSTPWRDPRTERQGGPFDHGFFFDSGAMPRAGEAPYIR